MKPWLIYLLQANTGLVLFYMAYQLGIKRSQQYGYLRFFLLTSALLSLILPLVGLFSSGSNTVIELDLQEILVYQLYGNAIGVNEFSIASIVSLAYLLGVGIAALLFVFRLSSIFLIIKNGDKLKRKAYTLVRSNKAVSPFSFFHFLIVSKTSTEPKNEIIIHEKAHIKQLHSLDILLMEAFKIAFWFNPVAYFYQERLKEVHEYLADAAVLQETQAPEQYINLIMSKAFGVEPQTLSNTFFNSGSLSKRIKAIHASKGKAAKFSWINWLVFAGSIAMVVKVSLALAAPNWVGKEKDVFTEVEQMPQYPGGFNELINFMGSQIVYPQELMNDNIQGTVYVKFVVDKTGKVGEIKLLKGVHPQLDAIAVSTVTQMPTWIPGQKDGEKVAVSLTLPIRFAL